MIISREIQVDAGHRIPHHGGMCQGLHGHRYRIVCTVVASQEGAGAERDMAIDFQRLKRMMMEQIHMDCDHALILQADDPLVPVLLGDSVAESGRRIAELRDRAPVPGDEMLTVGRVENGTRFYLMPHAPTAERLAEHWGRRMVHAIKHECGDRVSLTSIEVWETPNCCATWVPDILDEEKL